MISKISFLILVLVVCLSAEVHSQNRTSSPVQSNEFRNNHSDFFHLYFTERTDLRIGYLHEFKAKESVGSNEYDLDNFFADGLFQASVSRDVFFSFGGTFDVRQYDFKGNNSFRNTQFVDDLYEISLSPGVGAFISDDFLIWGQSFIGNYSDLGDGAFDLDDYQVLGRVDLIYRINPGAQLILGASYSNDYLSQKLLPIFGIRLMSDTGALQIALDLPFKFRLGYYLNPKIEVFTQAVARGDQYNVRLGSDEFTVGVHDERAGGGIRFWLGDHVSWTFEGGRTLNSEFKIYRENSADFNNGDVDSHWFAQSFLGVAF